MKLYITLFAIIFGCLLLISCTGSDSPNGGTMQEAPDTLWTRYFGGASINYEEKVLQTDDGGFLLLGASTLSEGSETWLLKTDQDGDSLWKKTFEIGAPARGTSIQPTPDGGHVITGKYDLYANWSDIFLLKTDANGNELWHRVYAEGDSAGTQGRDIVMTPDGGYLILATYYYGPFSIVHFYRTWLLRTDANGDSLWCREFANLSGMSMVETWDGNYVVAGSTSPEGNEFWLMKTDADGEQLWSRTYDIDASDYAYSLEETTDGGYVIGGYCGEISSSLDYCLLKTDADSNEEWHRLFSELEVNVGFCARQTADGGYIFVGYTGASISSQDHATMIIKTNSYGFERWRKIIDLDYNSAALDVQELQSGGYIIAGSAGNMAWLVRLDSE